MGAPLKEQSHGATKTTEVLSLWGVVHAGPAEPVASKVLFRARLPEGESCSEPGPVARIAEGPGLLLGHCQR